MVVGFCEKYPSEIPSGDIFTAIVVFIAAFDCDVSGIYPVLNGYKCVMNTIYVPSHIRAGGNDACRKDKCGEKGAAGVKGKSILTLVNGACWEVKGLCPASLGKEKEAYRPTHLS